MANPSIAVLNTPEIMAQWLRELVGPTVDVCPIDASEESVGKYLSAEGPQLAFIGVDLPKKEGFASFTRIKGLARRLPVVLATISVPHLEMKLHEKLKIHADFYFDLRKPAPIELASFLAKTLGLDASIRDLALRLESLPSISLPDLIQEERTRAAQTDELPRSSETANHPDPNKIADLVFGDLGDFERGVVKQLGLTDTFPKASGDSPASASTSHPQANGLTLEVERLTRELEETRRAVQGSPFSDDFKKVVGTAGRKDETIETLRLHHTEQRFALETLHGFVSTLAKTLTHRESELEKTARVLKERTRHLQDTTEKSRLDGAKWNSEREGHRLEIERLNRASSQETERAEVRLTLLRQRSEETLQHSRRESHKALNALKQERGQFVRELQRTHEAALAQKASDHRAALVRATDEWQVTLKQSEAAQRDAYSRLEEKRQHELEQAANRRTRELEALKQRFESEITQQRAKSDAELERTSQLAKKHRLESARLMALLTDEKTTRGKLLHQSRNELDELRTNSSRALEGLRTDHEQQMERARVEMAKSQEQALAIALSEVADRSDKEKKQLKANFQSILAARGVELTKLRDTHASEMAALRTQSEKFCRDAEEEAARLVRDVEGKQDRALELRHTAHEEELAQQARLHHETLVTKQREFKVALRNAVSTTEANHKESKTKARQDFREAASALRKNHRSEVEQLELQARIALLKKEEELVTLRNRLAVTTVDGRRELDDRVEAHQQEILTIKRSHADNLEQLRQEHRAAIGNKDTTTKRILQEAIEGANKELEERIKLIQVEHRSETELLKSTHETALAELDSNHKRMLAEQQTAASAHYQALFDGHRTETRDRLHETSENHDAHVARLRREHDKEIARILAEYDTNLRNRDAALLAEHRKEMESLRGAWSDRLDKALAEHRISTNTLRQEQALAAEAAKRSYQQALEEAATRIASEWTRKLEETQRDALSETASLKAEHSAQLKEAVGEHAATMHRTLRDLEVRLKSAEQERDHARDATGHRSQELSDAEERRRRELAEQHRAMKRELDLLRKAKDKELTTLRGGVADELASASRRNGELDAMVADLRRSLGEEKKEHASTKTAMNRRLSEVRGTQENTIREVETHASRRIRSLETSLEMKRAEAAESTAREWQERLDDLREQHGKELEQLRTNIKREVSVLENELDDKASRLNALSKHFAEIVENHKALASSHEHRLAEQNDTIVSLRAVVDDFARSLQTHGHENEVRDQTIDSLKAVISDFYRATNQDGENAPDPIESLSIESN